MSLPGQAMVARCKRRIKRQARIDMAQQRMEWDNEQAAYDRACQLLRTAEHKVRLARAMAGIPVWPLFPLSDLSVPTYMGRGVTGDE